jgi:hypothetical protein
MTQAEPDKDLEDSHPSEELKHQSAGILLKLLFSLQIKNKQLSRDTLVCCKLDLLSGD